MKTILEVMVFHKIMMHRWLMWVQSTMPRTRLMFSCGEHKNQHTNPHTFPRPQRTSCTVGSTEMWSCTAWQFSSWTYSECVHTIGWRFMVVIWQAEKAEEKGDSFPLKQAHCLNTVMMYVAHRLIRRCMTSAQNMFALMFSSWRKGRKTHATVYSE